MCDVTSRDYDLAHFSIRTEEPNSTPNAAKRIGRTRRSGSVKSWLGTEYNGKGVRVNKLSPYPTTQFTTALRSAAVVFPVCCKLCWRVSYDSNAEVFYSFR